MKQKSFKLFRGKYCEFKKRLYICRPNREKGTFKKKFFTYWFKKQGMQKTLSIILELIARKQTQHYNGEFDPGSG